MRGPEVLYFMAKFQMGGRGKGFLFVIEIRYVHEVHQHEVVVAHVLVDVFEDCDFRFWVL